jgi:two-component system nitrate/nitrite response regulator NarL
MLATPIRVVVADDHALYRSGLVITLDAEDDITVVGQGETSTDAVALAVRLSPDIVLLDLNMPGDGISAAATIIMLRPRARCVIMTALIDEEAIERARRVGVCGVILKGVAARDLVRLLHTVALGGYTWPSPASMAPGLLYCAAT